MPERYPLTPLQRRMWFLQQLENYGQDDVISLACQASEALEQKAIEQRLEQVIHDFDALRVVIHQDGDDVSQSISTNGAAHGVAVSSLKTAAQNAGSKDLLQAVSRARRALLDQTSGPLFRVDLLRGPDGCDLLLLSASRLICDVDSLERIALRLLGEDGQAPASGDFAAYVRDNALDQHADLGGWVEKLHDATYVLELPLDRTRPAIQQGHTSAHMAHLSANVADTARSLAETSGAPQAVVYLAAYLALLYRYTLQDDILVGLARRPAGPDTPAVGPFTDMAVLHQQFSEGMTFADLLGTLKAEYADATATTPPPFPLLLEAISPQRDLSRAPLIQHGFEFQDAAAQAWQALPNITRMYSSASVHQLDLMLRIRPDGDGAAADWHYDSAIFAPETIQRMHGHYETLLASAAANAMRPLANLPLITPDEKELVTVTWNQTDSSVPDNDFVYRLFEKQVQRTPNAIAARQPGHTITYDALNRRANRMAHQLVDKGIGPDTMVALLADRDIDYLTAILAVNKAGGAYLPLGVTYPARRMASIFEKCETPLVLVGPNYLEAAREAAGYMPADKRPEIAVMTGMPKNNAAETNLPDRAGMNDLAYVMFTSGSTGEPKGVLVHHAGNINHIWAKIGDLEVGPDTLLAQTSRQSFDIVVWQFLAPLAVGGSIYIMPDDIALDPSDLLLESDRNGVTILQLVPVNIEALLDVAEAMGEARPALRDLRWMVPTGDALHTDLCRRWLSLYPHTRMLNTYGATECSDDQCHIAIDAPPPDDYRLTVMTIGRPIINTRIYILDETMQPVPVGVVGELYVGGVGVGRGYLKEPERTARTFVPDPFDPTPDARLYRSGDQARYLPDGTIEFIGRIGHMIKLHGMRIEPGEVQVVLGRHPKIAQAAINVAEFPGSGGKQMVAYVVFRKGQSLSEEDLRAYLTDFLPDYMIPAFFMPIEALPLNANGKLDRKALPLPDATSRSSAIIAPRTDTERALLGIWQDVLSREELSIRDNFFDVGGHSLLAMKLFSQIEQRFGKRLRLATIFRAATIAAQAELVDGTQSSGGASMGLSPDLICMVPIQAGDPARPAIFCIHAGGGHVIFFHALARYLGEDQPFYGIQALGIDGNHKPPTRFEDFAAQYVREIRAVQPEGPYYIGGECMGGTIGFEVARQLEEQGQEVGLLVMFDTYCAGIIPLKPGVPLWFYNIMFNVRRFKRHYYANLAEASISEGPALIMDIFRRTFETIQWIFFPSQGSKTYEDPLKQTIAALNQAEHVYKPGRIHAAITLFNGDLPWGIVDDETLGWEGHSSSGVDVHPMHTLFDMMIEGRDVDKAGKHLREVLDQKFAEHSE